MPDRIVLTDEVAVKIVTSHAKQTGRTPAESLVHMVGVAKSRLNATHKYAEKMSGKGKPRKAKRAKAKGPIARKARKAKKAELPAAPAPEAAAS